MDVDAPSGLGSNAQMDAIDALIAARISKPSGIVSGEAAVWNGTGWDRSSVTKIASGSFAGIKNVDVDAAAGIALSKLASDPTGKALGLTGATAATRYVGATASGAPASGTFAVGDFSIDQTGKIYVCTTAGSPGTWVQIGGGSSPGTQLDYVQITANVTITGSLTEATAVTVITGSSIAYDGTKNRIEVMLPKVTAGAGGTDGAYIIVLRDSTVLGRIALVGPSSAVPVNGVIYDTPSAASHTYTVKAYSDTGNAGTILAGAGGTTTIAPGFLRVTKA